MYSQSKITLKVKQSYPQINKMIEIPKMAQHTHTTE